MRIVILSRNPRLYSTKRLLEAAEKRGHEVMVVDHLKCNIEIEKKSPKIFYKGEYLENIDAIIPRIGASVTFYGTAVIRQFEMMKVFSSVGGAPLILKLLEGTQGLGVVLAETKNAATSVLEAFNGLGARVIAQEFIKEAGGADIRAFVVDGKVIGAMKRQGKDGEFRSNLHRGGNATIIELTDEEEKTALKATKALGLGIAGVDMLQSSKGPLVLEVNSSPGLEGIEVATGKNIAKEIIRYLELNVE